MSPWFASRSADSPARELTNEEKDQVEKAADELLETLKLVLDWRKQWATRAAVRVAIEETLDRLPEPYGRSCNCRALPYPPAEARRWYVPLRVRRDDEAVDFEVIALLGQVERDRSTDRAV
jgi:hypothetical protein